MIYSIVSIFILIVTVIIIYREKYNFSKAIHINKVSQRHLHYYHANTIRDRRTYMRFRCL